MKNSKDLAEIFQGMWPETKEKVYFPKDNAFSYWEQNNKDYDEFDDMWFKPPKKTEAVDDRLEEIKRERERARELYEQLKAMAKTVEVDSNGLSLPPAPAYEAEDRFMASFFDWDGNVGKVTFWTLQRQSKERIARSDRFVSMVTEDFLQLEKFLVKSDDSGKILLFVMDTKNYVALNGDQYVSFKNDENNLSILITH